MIIKGDMSFLPYVSTGRVQHQQEPLRVATGTGSRWTRWLRSLNIPLPSDFFWSPHLILRGHKEISDKLKGILSFQGEVWGPPEYLLSLLIFLASFYLSDVSSWGDASQTTLRRMKDHSYTTFHLSFHSLFFFFKCERQCLKQSPLNTNKCK